MLYSTSLLVTYFKYSTVYYVNPKLSIYPCLAPSFPPDNHKVHSLMNEFGESVSILQISSFASFFLDSACKCYHMIFILLCLIYFTQYDNPQVIHAAANGIISFVLMAE